MLVLISQTQSPLLSSTSSAAAQLWGDYSNTVQNRSDKTTKTATASNLHNFQDKYIVSLGAVLHFPVLSEFRQSVRWLEHFSLKYVGYTMSMQMIIIMVALIVINAQMNLSHQSAYQ